MKCLSEGSIQAYIDKELSDIEIEELEMHLFQCKKCKEIYMKLKSVNSFAVDKLQNYKEEFNINHIKTGNKNIKIKEKKGEFKIMKKYKKVAIAACAILAITTCVSVKPIRAAVINAASIFRANDIKGVNLSLDDVKKLQSELEKHKTDINIDKIGKIKYQGGEQKNTTMDEAKKVLSFTVLTPENISQNDIKDIYMDSPSKMDFTLNVENINQVLKSLGGKKLFPKDLDGKTFSLNMPGKIDISYKDPKTNKKIYISENKLPEIVSPDEANIDEIFNALSDLSILPYDMQKQLKSMKDWKSTFYIPNIGNKFEEMNINGTKAIGTFQNDKEEKHSNILMLKDNVLINITGNIDKNELLEITKSMR